MAYAAVVRSASASASRRVSIEASTDGDVLARFCIEQLLDAAQHLAPRPPTNTESHLHRLHMALVAAVPSVSLVLLPRILAEIKLIIEEHTGEASQGCRRELVHSLFSNIAENVGDAEKEYVMRWWEENRDHLGGHDEVKTGGGFIAPLLRRVQYSVKEAVSYEEKRLQSEGKHVPSYDFVELASGDCVLLH